MYSFVLSRDRNKKKTAKQSSSRSSSTHTSVSSSPRLTNTETFSRCTSQSPNHCLLYSNAPSSSAYTFPHPINRPPADTMAQSCYLHSHTDHQRRSLSAQGSYYQCNDQQQQQHEKFYDSSAHQQASVTGSSLSTYSTHVTHYSNQYDQSYINERLKIVAAKYEIQDKFVQRLHILEQFEIVVLCDDSGSMNTPVEGTHGTRWNELQTIVQIIMEIAVIFDSNGIDVHFLNRESIFNVTNHQYIRQCFAKPPAGLTPLAPALRRIFQLAAINLNRNKRLLVFIATDGQPTDEKGTVDINSLKRVMNTERQLGKMHVVFLTCTDDKSSVAYLSDWDQTMIDVDVIDDYKTEREEVRRMRGRHFPFSFGDYISKALLGAVDPEMDLLDESANRFPYSSRP